MRFSFLGLLLWSVPLQAGEKASLMPLRYAGFNKSKLLRLRQVLGVPRLSLTGAFSDDGKLGLFVSGGYGDWGADDAFLSLWDVRKGHVLKEIHIPGKVVDTLALAPDGKTALTSLRTVVTGIFDDETPVTTELVLWNLGTGKALHRFKDKDGPVGYLALAFSPDGKHALAARRRVGVQLIDLEKGKVEATIIPSKDETALPFVVLFPFKNRAVVSWGVDIHLWDLEKNIAERTFKGKREAVVSLAISSDGKRLASSEVGGAVRYWDAETGEMLTTLKGAYRNQSPSLAFAGSNLLGVWSSGADPKTGLPTGVTVALWDPERKTEIWQGHSRLHASLPIVVSGSEAVIGGGRNLFSRWSLKEGAELKIWGGHKAPVTAITVLPNGQMVSGDQDGFLIHWTGADPEHYVVHGSAVNALSASAGGLLLSASTDGSIKLADMKAGETLKTFRGAYADAVTGAVFGPGYKWIASAGADRVVHTWDLETGKQIAVISGHSKGINGLAISPDGSTLATASDDNTVRLWPLKEGRLVKSANVRVLKGHMAAATCVAFMPDGKRLLSGSRDKTIRVWNIEKERTEKVLEGHKNWISSLLVWKDKVVSTADDFRVVIWDLKKGGIEDVIDLTVYGDVPRCLALDAGGRGFYVGTASCVIMRFDELAPKE